MENDGKTVQYCKYGAGRRAEAGEPRPPLGQLTSRECDVFDHLIRRLRDHQGAL
ncbi:MAG: hypothetical protein R2715_22840 [Ilumatobacteraceae bacterium]